MRRGRSSLWIVAAATAVLGCGNESSTYDPVSVGGEVVIKVIGVVVSDVDQTPLADVSVWVDIGTEQGSEPRATARSNAEGRFTMVFTESDCSLATEMAYRVFARKKGFRDGEMTRDGNGGLPVLKCVTREQVIGFQLESA